MQLNIIYLTSSRKVSALHPTRRKFILIYKVAVSNFLRVQDCYFLFFISRIATISNAMVKIIINSSYVLISIILSVMLGSDGARPPTTWINILYSLSNKAAAYATASIHSNAYITAMRTILGQSVSHLNLFHGFQHISMPKV
jgi:hypothetical protein